MKNSFCKQIKNEIMAKTKIESCCSLSMVYGIILPCSEFTIRNKRFCITLNMYDDNFCLFFNKLIKKLYGGACEFEVLDETLFGKLSYELVIDEDITEKILNDLEIKNGSDLDFNFNQNVMQCENCAVSFIKGAFLSCGSTNIKLSGDIKGKGYHIEFASENKSFLDAIAHFLAENDADVKITSRGNFSVLYLSDYESIKILLAICGATKSLLELENEAIERGIRQKVNREINSAESNIKKQIDASSNQTAEIEFINSIIGIENLPEELAKVCKARLENKELTLSELAKVLGGGITKSGINHRMRKLHKIYENLKEQ